MIERHSHSRVEYMIKVCVSCNTGSQFYGSVVLMFHTVFIEKSLKFIHMCLPCLYHLQAKSQFKRRSTANNVEIHIPVPEDADSPKFKV